MIKTVDQKCYDLALHFLADYEPVPINTVARLAETIQMAVEDWFEGEGLKEKNFERRKK